MSKPVGNTKPTLPSTVWHKGILYNKVRKIDVSETTLGHKPDQTRIYLKFDSTSVGFNQDVLHSVLDSTDLSLLVGKYYVAFPPDNYTPMVYSLISEYDLMEYINRGEIQTLDKEDVHYV